MTLLRSLSNRIFAAGALLAVVPLGIAIWSVTAAVTAQAERELRRGLEEAATLMEENRETLFEHFVREARLIADLSRLKAIVELGDPPTAAPVAQFYRETIAADVLILTNRAGHVLARSGGAGLARDEDALSSRPAIREATAGSQARAFWGFPGGVLQVASVPIWIDPANPEILGTITVGFSLNKEVAERFKELTHSEIAFAIDGEIKAATLQPEDWPALAKLLSGGDDTVRLGSNEEEFAWLARPLAGSTASEGRPTALILRSRTERLSFLRAIYTALGVTALAAVLAATLLSYGVARTITRPLAVITANMRETAATGDLTRRISLPRSALGEDEDAQLLASTFNTMTESIGRFQREAAQRERLSSLGRLSTVVAHEIRNPLMIIKASLRSLRRDDIAQPELKRAVADIDEEITRLNRIVSDVLDFAKPIKFELAPTDINTLCRDAARAAGLGDGAAITLALDPTLPPVVTDAERLRLALVNILANARHAVEGSAQAGHPVELTTKKLGTARVAISIRDRGVGIGAETLPRIFEPYFTTKRGGSGLGLAIARNVVEGLGGTIAVTSRASEGTDITLDLPLTAGVLQPIQA